MWLMQGKGKEKQGREGHRERRGMAYVRGHRRERAWCLKKLVAVYLPREEGITHRVT